MFSQPFRFTTSLVFSVLFSSSALFYSSAAADRPDATEIHEAITADFQDAESLQDKDITVEVDDGTVTLGGSVDSYLDLRRAAAIAKRTRGVDAVINRLFVKPSERSDDAIRDDVINRIAANDSLHRLPLTVNVDRGQVAMVGEVESLAEKRIAGQAAAGVRGVTDVNNLLTVGLARSRSDHELRAEIQALITQSVWLDELTIDVEVEERIAKLSGTVHSVAQRDQLVRTAEIWGIQEINIEDVTIDADLRDPLRRQQRQTDVSDKSIVNAVDRSIANDPIAFVAAGKIEVAARDGTVTLNGVVNRERISTVAERLASDVVGVSRVRNELEVKFDGETPSDTEIVQLVQQAINRSPKLNRREMRVHSQAAHVRLYGIVGSQAEKNRAGWIAGGIPGVVHVNNALAVEKDWVEKSDERILADLKRKLKYAFLDNADDIEVEVHDGVAILSGTVDTWLQWQTLLDLALEAGARNPHSLVNVRYHPPHDASRVYVPEW